MARRIENDTNSQKRSIIDKKISSENKYPIFDFGKVDHEGPFRFAAPETQDARLLCSKILEFSKMTWAEIEGPKNHSLEKGKKGISKEGQKRIRLKINEDDNGDIFSFRLGSTQRLIGVRKDEVFEVIWYDKEHKFYPSKK